MRDGSTRTVRAIEHEDDQAGILRAASCDDELVQVIGRGRGVNRTAETPLEVQVLADVALPLVHERVLAWEIAQCQSRSGSSTGRSRRSSPMPATPVPTARIRWR